MRIQLRDYVENPQILIDVPSLGTIEYVIAENISAEITANPAGSAVIKSILSEATQTSGVDLFEITLDETPIGFIFGETVPVIKNGILTQASYEDMSSAILLLSGFNAAGQDMKKFIYTELEKGGNRILTLTVDQKMSNFRERDFGVEVNSVYRNS
jgi:hypothetical protein